LEGCNILKHIKEPILYQLKNRKGNYFEGWYFKQVTRDLRSTVCIIPGITKNRHDTHAFIQTIINTYTDSKPRHETHYHRFSANEFGYSDEPFSLKIGRNTFRADYMELDLSDEDYSLRGKIYFSEFTRIKTSILSPNIMGYFAYIPFMECYHGVISMSHCLNGHVVLDGVIIDFSDGRGYIEKDWGTSFPKEYVWFQSNNFKGSDASIMCSVARIPFLGTSFQGFICNLTLNGREYRFATYNRSKVLKLSCTSKSADVTLARGSLKIEAHAEISDEGTLIAPKKGAMNATVKEGLNGIVHLKLTDKSGTIFEGEGNPCGIELVRDLHQ